MVNAYLREAMGGEFTAKDFRTWGATMHAISLMADTPLPARAVGAYPLWGAQSYKKSGGRPTSKCGADG